MMAADRVVNHQASIATRIITVLHDYIPGDIWIECYEAKSERAGGEVKITWKQKSKPSVRQTITWNTQKLITPEDAERQVRAYFGVKEDEDEQDNDDTDAE